MPPATYEVQISPEAKADMNRLYDYIAFDCFQRDTADKYLYGIQSKIDKLAWIGGSIGISLNRNLQRQYGYGVRTITYKKMTIIYNVENNCILVRRIKPGKNII
ncbi:MAG: type II toxin-antitoxin system RelE/ParE family toxin [Prevotellaceae bacterium]|jgi:plasmid stabilization system protein ParE|nr:type II toxin-antitoxin system RelE/ParE family toxin [Prevotellaceae bacterium]